MTQVKCCKKKAGHKLTTHMKNILHHALVTDYNKTH